MKERGGIHCFGDVREGDEGSRPVVQILLGALFDRSELE